jgi:AbrB family looped-hinge helix DNA binding protein
LPKILIDAIFVRRILDRLNFLEIALDIVTISSKYQLVIPKAVRERLQLEPGQRVQTLVYGDRVELIPLRPARSLRGFVRGIDPDVTRDSDREF